MTNLQDIKYFFNVTVCYNNYFVAFSDITSILKDTPEKYELYHLLHDIMDKWYDIGLTLQVDRSILDDLTHSQDDDDLPKVMKILNCWKDTQPFPVTWETVITAIGESHS